MTTVVANGARQQPEQRRRISVAPMMDITQPRFRFLLRQLFPEIHLYTEMISAKALIHGDPQRFLQLHPQEPPVALQIGAHCPEEAYQAVRIACQWQQSDDLGFSEFNLNAGCPSERVQHRNIGAILMNDGPLVAEILAAMRLAAGQAQRPGRAKPQISLKLRLGIEQPSRGILMRGKEALYAFLRRVAPHCDRLIVHARIALLDGLDAKQNRQIPPLDYPLVLQTRSDFAPLPVELNGGLRTCAQIAQLWPQVDGLMLGRVSYEDTWQLVRLRQWLRRKGLLQNGGQDIRRSELVRRYADYLREFPCEQSLAQQLWPLLGLWHALPEARRWRRLLSSPYPPELLRTGGRSEAAARLTTAAQQTMQELEEKYLQD